MKLGVSLLTSGKVSGLLACCVTFPLFAQRTVWPGMDLNGDGVSDVWAAAESAENLALDEDPDGDGASTRDEAGSGTNPMLASSVLRTDLQHSPEGLRILWESVAGKSYQLERSEDLKIWQPVGERMLALGGPMSLLLADAGIATYRIRVYDIDQDQDGLTAYEELLLGSSDLDPSTGSEQDFERAFRLFASPAAFPLNGRQVQGQAASPAEAARFLQQADMGATYEEIQQLSTMGIPAWLDAQFALPPTLHVPINNRLTAYDPQEGADAWPQSPYPWTWWEASMIAPDRLRQRVAFALSEILVISQTTEELLEHNWGVATYYDLLVEHAFGNYRDLLYAISINPAMGNFLSHAKNRPTNLAQNRFPDENYAREVMQLFSIGLYELNQDGSRILDEQGQAIPSYSNRDIGNFAKVFTGLTYNPGRPTNGTPWFDDPDLSSITNENSFLAADPLWMGLPMIVYEPMHEQGEKILLNGVRTNGSLEQDLNAAIDNLFLHPNVGPFLGRLLIQRLVTSNPSPAYIYRVAGAFNDNGSGIRGDMKAVIRAVLLDPEARNRSFQDLPGYGKLREPLLRHVHLVRAFKMQALQQPLRMDNLSGAAAYAMQPMGSPSVFNFYLPDHQPAGPLRDAGLVAPEFQITTSTTTVKTLNLISEGIGFDSLLSNDDEWASDLRIQPDYGAELVLVTQGNLAALMDRLNLLLTRGQLSNSSQSIIMTALQEAQRQGVEADDIVRFAITLIASSPDFAVLR